MVVMRLPKNDGPPKSPRKPRRPCAGVVGFLFFGFFGEAVAMKGTILYCMQEEKVAIITGGGGMKCAYAAGALVALAKKLGVREPDIFISASGSVEAMFYYLAGQYNHIEKIWLRYLPSPEVVRIFPPALRIDYLIDTVMCQELPLNERAFARTKTRWFVPVTDFDTGHTEYVSNNTWFDLYEVVRAAKAIPLLYSGGIRTDSRPSSDGDINVNMADLIHKAHSEGATKIFLITNTVTLSSAAKWLMRTSAVFERSVIRRLMLDDIKHASLDRLPVDVEILVIGPSRPLPAGSLTRNRRALAQSYQMGWDDLLAKRGDIETLFT